MAFHEKAGRSQVGSLPISLEKVFLRRVATVAILPSALLVSDCRSVQVGCSRFSRCCHLFGDLSSILKDRSWATPLTQSLEPGFGLRLHFGQLFCYHHRPLRIAQRFVDFSTNPQPMQ